MFPIALIPDIMRNYGWRNGKRLMETWFSRPAAVKPRYGSPVAEIKMDWVLGFERARKVYNKLMSDKIWSNASAQKQIAKMLDRKGYLQRFPGTQPFGDLTQPVPALDADYINFRAAGGSDGPLDDLTAALGTFAFRVVVAGTVTPATKPSHRTGGYALGHDVTIDEVGIYVKDSYDFEGDQFLGFWTYPGYLGRFPSGYVSAWPYEDGELVTNGDFRRFRKVTGKGGDFEVFSDLKRSIVREPTTFNTYAIWEMWGDAE